MSVLQTFPTQHDLGGVPGGGGRGGRVKLDRRFRRRWLAGTRRVTCCVGPLQYVDSHRTFRIASGGGIHTV